MFWLSAALGVVLGTAGILLAFPKVTLLFLLWLGDRS